MSANKSEAEHGLIYASWWIVHLGPYDDVLIYVIYALLAQHHSCFCVVSFLQGRDCLFCIVTSSPGSCFLPSHGRYFLLMAVIFSY